MKCWRIIVENIIFEKDKMTSGSMQCGFIVRLMMWCSSCSCFQVIFSPNNPRSSGQIIKQIFDMIFSLSDIFSHFDAFAPKTVDILNQSIWKIEFIIIRLYWARLYTNTNFEKIWWSVFRAEQILPRTEVCWKLWNILNGTYRIIFRLMDFHLTLDYFTRTL